MIIAILWVLFALMVGSMGSSRTTGFFLTFLIALLLSPLIGLIWVAIDKKKDVVCKYCKFSYSPKLYYCPRCGKDSQGMTQDENKKIYSGQPEENAPTKKYYGFRTTQGDVISMKTN